MCLFALNSVYEHIYELGHFSRLNSRGALKMRHLDSDKITTYAIE